MQTSFLLSRLVAVLPALALCLVSWSLGAAEIQGILPVAGDGRTLNLDFEAGDLRDWTASGDAFKAQPVKSVYGIFRWSWLRFLPWRHARKRPLPT